MKDRHETSGFTLVELAITLVIIGLLVGGVLAAQTLRRNSQLIATIADVRSYGAATAIFLDRYSALPGDLPDANDRIPGCDNPSLDCASGAADSSVGDGDIGVTGFIAAAQTSSRAGAERETVLYWAHLMLTSMISGVSTAGAVPASLEPGWGTTHPRAPVGGGFHAKDASGGGPATLPGWPPLAQRPSGTFLVLQAAVDRDLVLPSPGEQIISPRDAAFIDIKIDDGDPFDGTVVGYGAASSPVGLGGCFAWSGVADGAYLESARVLSCGLAFRIAP